MDLLNTKLPAAAPAATPPVAMTLLDKPVHYQLSPLTINPDWSISASLSLYIDGANGPAVIATQNHYLTTAEAAVALAAKAGSGQTAMEGLSAGILAVLKEKGAIPF